MAKKKSNSLIKFLIIISLTAVLGIGATLAYLHDITDTKKNVFTSDRKISIQLREPEWDGYNFNDEPGGDGTTAKPEITGTELENLGITQASSYVPGAKIPKNPQIRNNGEKGTGVSSYVALKVEYFNDADEKVSYEDFKKAYLEGDGIAFDSKWTLLDNKSNEQIYLYEDILAINEDTSEHPLFKEVPLSLALEPKADGTGMLPKFEIKVTAYAIQSDNVSLEDAKTEMMKFAEI